MKILPNEKKREKVIVMAEWLNGSYSVVVCKNSRKALFNSLGVIAGQVGVLKIYPVALKDIEGSYIDSEWLIGIHESYFEGCKTDIPNRDDLREAIQDNRKQLLP
jgi:hypothetical protein